jgi:hypothetical protein
MVLTQLIPTARSVTTSQRAVRRAALVAAVGLFGSVLPSVLQASAQAAQIVDYIESVNPDGSITRIPIPKKTGFDLFAAEDEAMGAIRGTGSFRSGISNRGGPNSENQGSSFVTGHRMVGPGYNSYVFFQMGFAAAAPPTEFRKIRAVYPGINGMAGSLGYTALMWETLVSSNLRWGAADGNFGKTFRGTTSLFTNGGCRDDETFFREGFSLLAMRDCPDTWGSEGFKGKLVVPDSVWANTYAANPSGFRWDDWRISPSRLEQNNFLGSQSTYGFMSDYYREQKLRFGSVVPGGTGTPTSQGYPLGLELRIDAYQFSGPATRNTQFYQVRMVNKSADVYGTGIDYDSLYFGTLPGMLFGGFGGQTASVYFDFGSNTMYATKGNTSGNCSTSYPRRYVNTGVGACNNTSAFGRGVYAITILKSPMGDVRNKLFSNNPNSPYYNPSSPFADDTITFNHSHHNSVTTHTLSLNRSMRSAFGYLSSTEQNWLDGRNPSDIAVNSWVNMVQPEEWSGSYPALADVKFNKFVPGTTLNPATGRNFGSWDYNNDGVQDTISVPTCGKFGCAKLYSDTIAGGFQNNYGNIMNTLTAGPFKLKANDTTQFLYAFSHGTDSTAVRLAVEGATNSYLTNYAGPQPFQYPTVVAGKTYSLESAELIDSTRFGIADASVGARITFRYPYISPIDPFMVGLVNKIRRDSTAGDATTRRLLRLNPGILDRLSARAQDNLSSVYVFKTCDGGTTFTTTTGNAATCVSSITRTIDGGQAAFAFRPFQQVLYTNGVPASGSFNEFVQAGKIYGYSFVTRTRGFSDFPKLIDSTATGLALTDVQTAFGFPLDTINSTLATSGPASATIYAPITNTAGRVFARVDTSTIRGNATQPIQIDAVSNDVSGTTRMVFGNQFIVRKTIDTATNAQTTTINVRHVIPRAAGTPAGPAEVNFVARDQSFTINQNIPVRSGANILAGTPRANAGSARVFVDTLVPAGNSLGYLWVTGDNKPIFLLSDLGWTNAAFAANQARDQAGSPTYPGFSAVPYDSSNSASGFRRELVNGVTARDRNFVLRGANDTLSNAGRNFVPQVQGNFIAGTVTATNKRIKGGSYELTWQTDPWGPRAPFRLDPVASLQGEVTTSLADVASKATTISETSAAVGALVGATAARPLVRVRIPFSMTFTDPVANRKETVKFAMLRRPGGNTRLLGSGNDTVRVAVPDSIWLPGDTLIALQKVERDSIVGTGATAYVVVQADGTGGFRPIPVLVDSIGLNKFVVACNGGTTASGLRPATDDKTCNPLVILSRGASPSGGYLAVQPGWRQVFELTRTFDARSEVQLVATPFTTKPVISKADLNKVSVVPNPYVVRSDIDNLNGRTPTPRIYFTGVPEEGILRVYSVSGQFLQELTWKKSDLTYSGNNASTGDLPFNLRTREGLDMSSGLYLYVLTATGVSGNDQIQRGKFVIIR